LTNTGKVHFFIGPNNSGKTNILDAIFQLFNKNNSKILDPSTDLTVKFVVNSQSGKNLIVNQSNNQKKFMLDGKLLSSKEGEKLLHKHIIRLCATRPIGFERLFSDYSTLKNNFPTSYQIFTTSLKKYFPDLNIDDSFLDTKKINDNDFSTPFERLSDGLQQIFTILLYIFHPIYTIILLEEPEIHLHPGLIKKLLKNIESEELSNQIFLTTHSPLFIHTLNLHRLFRVIRENNSTIVYSPRLTGQKINYSRLTQELNADNCEMFFAEKILLVEGPSDHILMRGLIDRFYQGNSDVKVIQIYGKSNLDVYTNLLEMFNISYTVLLDEDALHDPGIELISKRLFGKSFNTEIEQILFLKSQNIFILPNGSIENNYPKKYQKKRKHKPHNALFAASHITEEEFSSQNMSNLREIIASL